jgi:putative ABC transport system permease protein
MDELSKDIRFALKLMLKERAFTAATLLTLALCTGANTAMFSVLNSVLLKPLPFNDPQELVHVFNSYPRAGIERGGSGVPDYYDRRELQAFESLAMYQTQGLTIGEAGRPERVTGLAVTPSLFGLLGLRAHAGRTFTDDEGEPGNEHQAILSYGLWQEQYAGSPDALGQTIRINDVAHTIVGVMPRNFTFHNADVRVWTPLAFTAEQRSDDARHSNSWSMIGRLREGYTLQRAQAEIDALNRDLDERLPQFAELLANVGFRTEVRDYHSDMTRDVRGTLWLLQGGVLLVLLIGCVNIANLILVRSTVRHRELATRSALGAPQRRLVRQLITEGIVLAVVGAALGLLVAWGGVRAFAAFAAEELPRGTEIGLDLATLAAAAGVALLAGVLFGAIPVARLMRADLSNVFRDEGRSGTAGRRTQAWRSGLVVAQVSLAFTLLVGAGLLVASFARLMRVDPGFEPQRVLTASLSMPATRYPDAPARYQAAERLLERVRAIPGVSEAGATNVLPFAGDMNSSAIAVRGYVPQPGESLISPINSRVSTGYFEAMSIAVVAGRTFNAMDVEGSEPVAIIDRELAERFWSGRDPIGQQITQGVEGVGRDDELDWRTIVGVVDHVRVIGLTGDQPPGHYYVPLAQQPAARLFLTVRSALDATQLTAALRTALAEIDADIPLYETLTMTERVTRAHVTERARMWLLAGFAGLALLLAAVGIYGVLAYSVAQRSAEIGIRMALGSSTRDVFRMVFAQGARLMAAGIVVGLLASLALTRLVASMLYGVEATDPAVYLTVLALIGLTAAAACAVPARRAMQVDPLVAIRDNG